MKSWLRIRTLLTLTAFCVLTSIANATPRQYTLLILGDSLSASYGIEQKSGWVSLLAERLRQQKIPANVVNAAISGDTTAGGLSRLGPALQTHHPDLLLLELGGNDGLRGLPIKAMHDNLASIIDQAQASGAKVLLLGIRVPPSYGKRYTDAFEKVYVDLAREKNIPLVPFILKDVANHAELMQNDSIHPTAEAQQQVLDNIWPTLLPLLPLPAK